MEMAQRKWVSLSEKNWCFGSAGVSEKKGNGSWQEPLREPLKARERPQPLAKAQEESDPVRRPIQRASMPLLPSGPVTPLCCEGPRPSEQFYSPQE